MKGNIVTVNQLIIGNKYYFEYTGEDWDTDFKHSNEGAYECQFVNGEVDLVNEYGECINLKSLSTIPIVTVGNRLRTTIYGWKEVKNNERQTNTNK